METEEVIETPETIDEGEVDYKALVEQERAAREQAEAKAEKYKGMFKSEKAKANDPKTQ
jgi:hypothetical protein